MAFVLFGYGMDEVDEPLKQRVDEYQITRIYKS